MIPCEDCGEPFPEYVLRLLGQKGIDGCPACAEFTISDGESQMRRVDRDRESVCE